MSVAEPVIRFEEVDVSFEGRVALREVTIDLNQRRIGVIGSNGSGKSTFARLLNGLVTPSSGEVRVLGLDPVRQGRELRGRTGFVFSNPDVQVIMPSVAEDIAFSLRGRGLGREETAQRVADAIARVGLDGLGDVAAHSLSSGQRQLLALAAILVTEPGLIIADEPTALLDARNSRIIAGHLLDDPSHRVVIVTHDLALAARCDIVVRFDRGRLVDVGDPARVIAAYESVHA